MILGFIFKKTFELYDYGFFSMFVPMPFFVAAFKGLADKDCGKVSKDISLYKCHQDLDQVDEDRQQDEEG